MRLRPTNAAMPKKHGAPRGQTVVSVEALANDAAVWPLGKDHEPGFLPITSASTMRANGRRRRKNDLIGCSTSQVASSILEASRLTASAERGTCSRYATRLATSQTQPPVVTSARPHA